MSEQFSIYDMLAVFGRRKLIFFATFLAVMLLTVVAVITARSQFASQAKLFVRVGRESIGLDPTATVTGQVLGVNVKRETEINSVAELVRSRNVFESVADAIGVDRILQPPDDNLFTPVSSVIDEATSQLKSLLQDSTAGKPNDPAIAKRENAVAILDKSVSVNVPKASSVVTVSAKAFSPELAREIAASVVEHYLAAHSKSSRPEGSLEFFTQQTSELKAHVADMRDQLASRRIEDGIISLDSQFEMLSKNKSELEARMLLSQGNRDSSVARKKQLETLLEAESKTMIVQETAGGLGAPSTGMRRQLFDLEIQASELMTLLDANHPKVLSINQQIKQLRSVVGTQQGNEDGGVTQGINPAWQQLQLSLSSEIATLAAHEAALTVVEKQLNDVNAEVALLNRRSRAYEDLSREIELADQNYRRYSESLEHARMDSELESNNITNVTIAQDATLVSKPIFPDKKTILIIGTCLAAMCAFGMSLLADFLDRSFRTADEIEDYTGLPVIGTIPKTSRRLVKI